MRHIITLEDIQPTIEKAKILLAHSGGNGHSKSLFMIPTDPNNHFHVYEHNEVVLDTVVLSKAIEKYNELD